MSYILFISALLLLSQSILLLFGMVAASPSHHQIATVKFLQSSASDHQQQNQLSLLKLQNISSHSSSSNSDNHHVWFEVKKDRILHRLVSNNNNNSSRKSLAKDFLQSIENIKRDIVDAQLASFQFSASTPMIDNIYDFIHLAAYENNIHNQDSIFLHLFLDPRVERLHDGHDDRHHHKTKQRSQEQHQDKIFVRKSSIERFWLPLHVKQLHIKLSSHTNQQSVFTLPLVNIVLEENNGKARTAKTQQQQQKQPELITIREVGPPSTQYSYVFLATGYLASQRDMFIKNVTDLVEMMADPVLDGPASPSQDASDAAHDIHRSNPFSKYWSFWNIYAVFEPSNEQGASRPAINQQIDNNLDCIHPAEIERAVSCDRQLSIALAAVSPAPVDADPERVMIINLVNTAIYGGSAIYIPGKLRLGSFFNGFYLPDQDEYERMLSLTVHEMGHSGGDLMDEYNIQVNEPSGRYIRNCQVESSGGGPPNDVQWNPWIQAQSQAGGRSGLLSQYGNGLKSAAAQSQWGVLTVPESVCGFTNYYKPNSNCMMHRLNDYFMCPVCRQEATLAIMKNHFELDWPRFPFKDQVLVVYEDSFAQSSFGDEGLSVINTSSTVVLHLNRVLTQTNGYTLNAFDGSDDSAALEITSTDVCPACIFLGPSNFAKYPRNREIRIRVGVSDSTNNFVLSSSRTGGKIQPQLQQTTYFRLVVVDSSSGADVPRNVASLKKETSSSNNSSSSSQSQSQDYSLFFNYSSRSEMRTQNFRFGVDLTDMTPRVVLCLHSNTTFENRLSQTDAEKNASFCRLGNAPAKTYERPADLAGLLVSFDLWVPIVAAGLGIFFLALWLWACNAYSEDEDGQVKLIFRTDFSLFLTIIRNIMLGAAVIILFASLAAVGVSIYVYYNTSVLGKFLVVGGVIISVLLYVYAFLGFWSVMSRSTGMLILNAVCLAIPLGCLIYLLVVLQSLGEELKISRGLVADFVGGGKGNGDQQQQQETTTTTQISSSSTTTTSTTEVPTTSTTTTTTNSPSSPSSTTTTTTTTSGGIVPPLGPTTSTTTTTTSNGGNPSSSPSSESPSGTTTPSPSSSDSTTTTTSTTTPAPDPPGEWMLRIQDFWIWLVADHPGWACSLQGMLECSGYYTSCSGTLGSSATCPSNCDETNERYFSPCQTLIRQYIVEHYNSAILALGITTCVLGLAFILNLINLGLLWKHQKKLEAEHAARIKKIEEEMAKRRLLFAGKQGKVATAAHRNKALFLLRSLEPKSQGRRSLIREIKRLALTKKPKPSFDMTKTELSNFFNATMGYQPPNSEIDEIFQLADTSKEGVLSIKEFLLVFGWSIKEFKSVPPPPPPKSALNKTLTFAKEKSLQLSHRLNTTLHGGVNSSSEEQKDQETELLSPGTKEKEKSRRNNRERQYRAENNSSNNNNNTIDLGSGGEILESEGESDDEEDDGDLDIPDEELLLNNNNNNKSGVKKSDDSFTPWGKDKNKNNNNSTSVKQLEASLSGANQSLRQRRHEMRRRSSLLLGGDIVAWMGGTKHEHEASPLTPPLSVLPKTASRKELEVLKTTSLKDAPTSKANTSLTSALEALQLNQNLQDAQKQEFGSPTMMSSSTKRQVQPTADESRAPLNSSVMNPRHSASNFNRNEHSLFAVPPPRADHETDDAKSRLPPRIFDEIGSGKNNNNKNNNRSEFESGKLLESSMNPLASNHSPRASFRGLTGGASPSPPSASAGSPRQQGGSLSTRRNKNNTSKQRNNNDKDDAAPPLPGLPDAKRPEENDAKKKEKTNLPDKKKEESDITKKKNLDFDLDDL